MDRHEHVQSRRSDRDATHHSGIEAAGPTGDVCNLLRGIGRGPHGGVRYSGCGPVYAALYIPHSGSACSACSAVSRPTCRSSPTRLRGTGPGFTYNIGRLIAAAGPFLVGAIAARGVNALDTAMDVLFYVGIVPLIHARACSAQSKHGIVS